MNIIQCIYETINSNDVNLHKYKIGYKSCAFNDEFSAATIEFTNSKINNVFIEWD